MKSILVALACAFGTQLLAQAACPVGSTCITIPAQQVPLIWNGKTLKVNIPAQTVPLPALSGSSLPAGLTFTPASGTTPAVLAVAGNVSAASISLSGGPPLPTSANGLYLLQMQATGFLTPVPYVPVVLPAMTVTQADPTTNSFTTP